MYDGINLYVSRTKFIGKIIRKIFKLLQMHGIDDEVDTLDVMLTQC